MLLRLTSSIDPVTRGWATVAVGSAARLALGFVASVLIARSLGPSAFAVFAVLAAASGVAGAVADLGLSDAGVKRVAEVWPEEPAEASVRGNGFFWLRCVAAGALVLVACVLARPLCSQVLGIPDPFLLVLAMGGVLATAMSGAVTSLLQASGRFRSVTAVMLANSGLTAIMAVGLAATDMLNLWSALAVLGIGTSLVAFGLGVRLLPERLKLSSLDLPNLRHEARRLVPFGFWLWVGGIFAALAAQLDLFFVNRWLDPAVVGFYALALNLASKVEVANHSLYTVLLPSASALKDEKAIRSYLRSALLRSGLLACLLLPLFPLAGLLIGLFYGPAFLPAAPIFQMLLIVAIFELFTTPILLLAFTFDRPRVVTAAEAARAGFLGIAGLWLVPVAGLAGAVVSRFISRVAGVAVVLALLRTRRP